MRFRWLIALALGFGVFFAPSALSQYERLDLELEADPDEPVIEGFPTPVQDVPVLPEERVQELGTRADDLLRGLQDLLSERESDLSALQDQALQAQKDLSTLEGQIQLLEREMRSFVLEAHDFITRVRDLQEHMERLQLQKKLKGMEIADVFAELQDVVMLLYRIRRTYVLDDGKLNVYGLVFQDGRVSDVLLREHLTRKMEHQAKNLLLSSAQKYAYAEQVESRITAELARFEVLLRQIELSFRVLSEQRKYHLQLLHDSREGRDFFVREFQLAQEEYKKIQEELSRTVARISKVEVQGDVSKGFIWPVDPAHGLSAHFLDAKYFERFGIPHFAIDIPTEQLSPVRAIADALVAEVHDSGGSGYSYLVLAHPGGFQSVYGHIFSFEVRPGDLVQQGDVVALSGGSPGTHGAGRLTTGAHLHLELWKDGKQVDPERYLPKLNAE